MKTILETCKASEETKTHVETFIENHDLFSVDYEVTVFTCSSYQSVAILCEDYQIQLSRLCQLFKEEFGSELHVTPTHYDSSKLEFWFLVYGDFNNEF